jgi:hypothetical protein
MNIEINDILLKFVEINTTQLMDPGANRICEYIPKKNQFAIIKRKRR